MVSNKAGESAFDYANDSIILGKLCEKIRYNT